MTEIPFLAERVRLKAVRDEITTLQDAQNAAEAEPRDAFRRAATASRGAPDQQTVLAPLRETLRKASEPFASRLEELSEEEDALSDKLGSRLFNLESLEHDLAPVCAITGAPILQTDEVRLVLASAIPVPA